MSAQPWLCSPSNDGLYSPATGQPLSPLPWHHLSALLWSNHIHAHTPSPPTNPLMALGASSLPTESAPSHIHQTPVLSIPRPSLYQPWLSPPAICRLVILASICPPLVTLIPTQFVLPCTSPASHIPIHRSITSTDSNTPSAHSPAIERPTMYHLPSLNYQLTTYPHHSL